MIFFEKEILAFFKQQGRNNLPWRKKNITAYEVWVSEVMLQQTQVNRVIDYYIKFLEKYPTVFHLAKSNWDEFLPYYAGLGYYRRGQNMIKCAQKIVEEFGGEFPRDKKTLTLLPGIGDYTASAILAFAYNEDHLAFDTNLQKVFGRFLFGNKKAKINQEQLESKLVSNKKILNGAIMDFANLVCLNKPKCETCPLKSECKFFKENGKNEITPKKESSSFPTKEAQVFLWLHKDHKEYYSQNPDRFEVFQLPASVNTREGIKNYFRDRFQLELAVRPPHKKVFIQGIPTLFVNAQILQGVHSFGVFKKEEISEI